MLRGVSGDDAHLGRDHGFGPKPGKILRAADGLIAATALRHGFVVMTQNTEDFAAFGVRLLNLGQRDAGGSCTVRIWSAFTFSNRCTAPLGHVISSSFTTEFAPSPKWALLSLADR